ncbi:MAG TPA: site-specific integrase [Microlunatus sp.]
MPAPKVDPWKWSELKLFLQHPAVRAHRLLPVLLLSATTGLRRGEVCGLQWSDLDLVARRLVVRKARTVVRYEVHEGEPKSRSGTMRSGLLAPEVVAALLRWQLVQEEEADQLGVPRPAYVATAADGSPLHPERLTRTFQQLRKLVGLRPVRLHDLRHGYASKLLKEGVPMAVVSMMYGHADIRTTVNIYGHLDVTEGLEAADLAVSELGLDEVLS